MNDRTIPELPYGWKLGNLYEEQNGYVCVLIPALYEHRVGVRGEGATIRESVFAAIKEISECQS